MATATNTTIQRMLPSVAAAPKSGARSVTANGRLFTAVAGTTVDAAPQDVTVLEANKWFRTGGPNCLGVGTTAQRPTDGLFAGCTYVDTTLGYTVTYDGTTWRNQATGASV